MKIGLTMVSVGALLLAGCPGSDDTSTSTTVAGTSAGDGTTAAAETDGTTSPGGSSAAGGTGDSGSGSATTTATDADSGDASTGTANECTDSTDCPRGSVCIADPSGEFGVPGGPFYCSRTCAGLGLDAAICTDDASCCGAFCNRGSCLAP